MLVSGDDGSSAHPLHQVFTVLFFRWLNVHAASMLDSQLRGELQPKQENPVKMKRFLGLELTPAKTAASATK